MRRAQLLKLRMSLSLVPLAVRLHLGIVGPIGRAFRRDHHLGILSGSESTYQCQGDNRDMAQHASNLHCVRFKSRWNATVGNQHAYPPCRPLPASATAAATASDEVHRVQPIDGLGRVAPPPTSQHGRQVRLHLARMVPRRRQALRHTHRGTADRLARLQVPQQPVRDLVQQHIERRRERLCRVEDDHVLPDRHRRQRTRGQASRRRRPVPPPRLTNGRPRSGPRGAPSVQGSSGRGGGGSMRRRGWCVDSRPSVVVRVPWASRTSVRKVPKGPAERVSSPISSRSRRAVCRSNPYSQAQLVQQASVASVHGLPDFGLLGIRSVGPARCTPHITDGSG